MLDFVNNGTSQVEILQMLTTNYNVTDCPCLEKCQQDDDKSCVFKTCLSSGLRIRNGNMTNFRHRMKHEVLTECGNVFKNNYVIADAVIDLQYIFNMIFYLGRVKFPQEKKEKIEDLCNPDF